jgi:hypothetical protein
MACFIQLFGGPLDGHKVKERNDYSRGISIVGNVMRIRYMPDARDVFQPDQRGDKWAEYGLSADGTYCFMGSGERKLA